MTESIQVANRSEFECDHDLKLFRMHAGAYGETRAYVWSDSFESAFESFVEWLDENAPRCLTTVGEDELKSAATELGIVWPSDPVVSGFYESSEFERIRDLAETDLTAIGHTTLRNGTHIVSSEWRGDEIERGSAAWNETALASDGRTYYAYGNGLPGCMHDGQNGPYDTASDAAEDAARILELDPEEEAELTNNGIVYLRGDRVHEVGAAMIEVFEVDSTWKCQG